ncbi:MAG: phosphatidate cytidylyltransferase [Termitinemataceae bacterium]|nr:MAG: phosphatidate cytidylyltransferase [Termitinemataceae bacterium]
MSNAAIKNKLSPRNIIVRKCLHFLIALAPLLAALSYPFIIIALCTGTVFYAFIESARFSGGKKHSPIRALSSVISFASHRRDKSRFVLGPLTLGAGALTVLIFFNTEASIVAILSLAVGDGLAGLVGRLFGRVRPKILHGKSVEGSITCFTAITIVCYIITGKFEVAICSAFVGTVTEALPIEDFDNILLPFFVALVVKLLG